MKQTVLAKRYAKALLMVGQENNTSEQYLENILALSAWYRDVPQVRDSLTNPLYPQEIREKVGAAIAQAMGADQVFSRFLVLLVQKKRATIVPEIADEFQKLIDDIQNICRGSVVSARKMTKKLQEKVQQTLENITGKTVELTVREDAALIGGMVAQVGDLVLDASVRTQLAGLKESIKGSE